MDKNTATLARQLGDRYEILARIRVGGMGAIYKVRHRLLDEVRVVKAVRHPESSGKAAERFLREARAATRLRHPNVAVLHDFVLGEGGQAYIVMEHIEGWNLFEILRGYGPPPLPLTLEIAHQALKALAYLHRFKLVHLDISPDNLMLARDEADNPLVKLIDLGIARSLGERQTGGGSSGFFTGKPRYGSPERFNGAPWDERTDLYSFGVVLYELLTGCCPIVGNETDVLRAGHLHLPPRDFDETDPGRRVPEDLRELVLEALAKKPEDRLPSAEDFLWRITMIQDRFPLSMEKTKELWRSLHPLEAPDREEAVSAPQGSISPPTVLDGPRRVLEAEALCAEAPGALEPVEPFATRATVRAGRVPPEPAPAYPAEESEEWASRPLRVSPSTVAEMTPESVARAGPAARPPGKSAAWAAVAGTVLIATLPGGWSAWAPRAPEPARLMPAAPRPLPVPAAMPLLRPEPPASPKAPAPVAPQPSPEPPRPRSGPPPASVPAAPPQPMRPGDMILRGQPGVEVPEIKLLPPYSHPEGVQESGGKVSIRIALLVDENGQVIDARVQDGGAAGAVFERTALEAAKQALFFPPLRDGVPGKMWTELLLEF